MYGIAIAILQSYVSVDDDNSDGDDDGDGDGDSDGYSTAIR